MTNEDGGHAVAGTGLDAKPGRGMTNREFGLYASRVLQPPAKHPVASDPDTLDQDPPQSVEPSNAVHTPQKSEDAHNAPQDFSDTASVISYCFYNDDNDELVLDRNPLPLRQPPGPAPQLPSASPVSPLFHLPTRWDSLANSRAVVYNSADLSDPPTSEEDVARDDRIEQAGTACTFVAPLTTVDLEPLAEDPAPNAEYVSSSLTIANTHESYASATQGSPLARPRKAMSPTAHNFSHPSAYPPIPEQQPILLGRAAPRDPRYGPSSPVTAEDPANMYRPESRQTDDSYSTTENFNFSRPRKQSIKSNGYEVSTPTRSRTAPVSHNGAASDFGPPNSNPPNFTPPKPPVSARSRAREQLSSTNTATSPTGPSNLPARTSHDNLHAGRKNPPKSPPNILLATATNQPSVVAATPSPRHPRHHDPQSPWLPQDEFRTSYRSQLTASSAQGTLFTATGTARSSVNTKTSSVTSANLNALYFGPNGVGGVEGGPDDGLSVDDVMGMYEKGFGDDSGMEDNEPTPEARGDIDDTYAANYVAPEPSRPSTAKSYAGPLNYHQGIMHEPLPIANNRLARPGEEPYLMQEPRALFGNSGLSSSLPQDIGLSLAEGTMRAEIREERREKFRQKESTADYDDQSRHDSAKSLDRSSYDQYQTARPGGLRESADRMTITPSPESAKPEEGLGQSWTPPKSQTPLSASVDDEDPGARDQYGFLKASQYITREEYDKWEPQYSEFVERRRKKWVTFMRDNGLMTTDPDRFPLASDKTKRFIRKGIPPEWRGAAWWYYAKGPGILSKHRGVYDDLLRRVERGEVREVCREDIERDLYRTFPDNIKFRRPRQTDKTIDPRNFPAGSFIHSRDGSTQSANPTAGPAGSEPILITQLRRVLQAFSIHNPAIGYCQSLNFLAGLLLLFVDTEEKAFWLLNVIACIYLPGTHATSLEGSKVDISVLMAELRKSLPGVYAKISEAGNASVSKDKKQSRKQKAAAAAAALTDTNNLPPVTLALTAWFMSCYIGTLPIESVLRVWDIFFYEGSKTLFRVALGIFKVGESQIKSVSDPMEIFGVVQSLPRKILDINALLEVCYKRRGGFSHITAKTVDDQRLERREKARQELDRVKMGSAVSLGSDKMTVRSGGNQIDQPVGDAISEGRSADAESSVQSVRRHHTLFGRKKDRDRPRLTAV